MRTVRLAAVALTVVAAGIAPVLLGQGLSNVKIQAQDLGGGVHMLTGRGGNIGVSAGEDGVFLIDDQFAELTGRIKAAVEKISDKPIKFVLNTHWHPDHTGGNENLGKAGALIVAHDNVRVRLTSEQFSKRFGKQPPKAALPIVTFTDAVTLHLNGDTIHCFHVLPAHTDGDSVVHFEKANVIHTGDLFFNGMYPYIDISSGGNVDGVIAATDRLIKMADDETKIIPGHGPLSNHRELGVYRDMLKSVRDAVAKLIDEGKTLQEVIAAKPSEAFDAKWGGGFMKPVPFVTSVYNSLVP